MKIITAGEMRQIDRLTTEKHGVPSLQLMENAGTAVADFARKHFVFSSVCVVSGKGNNGGDGFVAARKLKEAGKQVRVIALAGGGDELRGDAAEMLGKLPIQPLWVTEEAGFNQTDVKQALGAELIVDAILGTGFKPPIQGIPAKAVEIINRLKAPVVAVDVPSGMDADATKPIESGMKTARADAVITFTAPKPAHVFLPVASGPIAVAEIGSPPSLVNESAKFPGEVMSMRELGAHFPPRRANANKGNFGHVLVIGGSVGKAGAAAMAGMAALKTGAGLVTVACPRSAQPTVASFAAELMTEALPETAEGTISEAAVTRLEELIEAKQCLAIGPGLSRNPETERLVRRLVGSARVPVVLDADGLNAFAGHVGELSGDLAAQASQRTLVLTPHPGEMSRLLGGVEISEIERDRLKTALDYAREHRVILVLKGHRTVIASPQGELFINVTGNPGMAKGGSGDVLTGIAAGLIAQHSKLLDSQTAKLEIALPLVAGAVCLHGLAGNLSRDLHGEYSMTATEIIESVPDAIRVAQENTSEFAYLLP